MFEKLKKFYYSLLRRFYMWRLSHAVNNINYAIGKKLLPALKTAIQSFSEFADALQSFDERCGPACPHGFLPSNDCPICVDRVNPPRA